MKKFKFTLEKYLDMKIGEDEKLKRSLSDITNEIGIVNSRIADIEEKEVRRRREHSENCKKGITGIGLHEYSEYMGYLHDMRIELDKKLEKLTKKSDEYKEKLIILTNEIKALNKMKEEQKQAFLKEIEDDATRQIDEFVSFKAYSSL